MIEDEEMLLAIANDPAIVCPHPEPGSCPLCLARARLAARALTPKLPIGEALADLLRAIESP